MFGETAFTSLYYSSQADFDRSSSLTLTANLKGAHIAQDLDLYQDLVQALSTRTLVQEYLKTFNAGNTSQTLLNLIAVRGRAMTVLLLLTYSG